jgi:hypothetical protein
MRSRCSYRRAQRTMAIDAHGERSRECGQSVNAMYPGDYTGLPRNPAPCLSPFLIRDTDKEEGSGKGEAMI